MMWNTLTDIEVLASWKKLRTSIKDLSCKEKLQAIAEFSAPIPYGSRTVDYFTPSSWPGPWEILAVRSFCTSSISLLIFYTFVMVDDTDIRLELIDDGQEVYLVPVVDDQFVLNFYPNLVSNYQEVSEKFNLLKVFSKTDIKPVT